MSPPQHTAKTSIAKESAQNEDPPPRSAPVASADHRAVFPARPRLPARLTVGELRYSKNASRLLGKAPRVAEQLLPNIRSQCKCTMNRMHQPLCTRSAVREIFIFAEALATSATCAAFAPVYTPPHTASTLFRVLRPFPSMRQASPCLDFGAGHTKGAPT